MWSQKPDSTLDIFLGTRKIAILLLAVVSSTKKLFTCKYYQNWLDELFRFHVKYKKKMERKKKKMSKKNIEWGSFVQYLYHF